VITSSEINEVISVYTKHGWDLSRVLLSDDVRLSLGPVAIKELFSEVEIEISDLNAVWFERDRADGGIAWEIRQLSVLPYALCESFFNNATEEEISGQKKSMENRMRERASDHKKT
jgi:hypothetical protein